MKLKEKGIMPPRTSISAGWLRRAWRPSQLRGDTGWAALRLQSGVGEKSHFGHADASGIKSSV